MMADEIRGTIFNIQRFSVHDGPGIRTVVFEKGCPLRCRWCANPESQAAAPEIAWTKSKCIDCKCCKSLRQDPDGFRNVDPETLRRTCPTGALHVFGESVTVDEVMERVTRDGIFYANMDGGLTISGGEPLMQPDFTYSLLKSARSMGIHTAIETTGYARYEVFERIAGEVDYLLMDIKSIDEEIHIQNTGVSKQIILSNFARIKERYPMLPMLVRTPVIPGVNDSEEEIRRIRDYIRPYENVHYELLKYHRFGEAKYESLQRNYPMENAELDAGLFEELKRFEF